MSPPPSTIINRFRHPPQKSNNLIPCSRVELRSHNKQKLLGQRHPRIDSRIRFLEKYMIYVKTQSTIQKLQRKEFYASFVIDQQGDVFRTRKSHLLFNNVNIYVEATNIWRELVLQRCLKAYSFGYVERYCPDCLPDLENPKIVTLLAILRILPRHQHYKAKFRPNQQSSTTQQFDS